MPARPLLNDLLPLPLAQRLDGFLADGELQVETLHSGSIRLKVYGVGRTLVDCFRHRRRLGMEPVLEALKDAINQRRLNVDELWRQAQAQRMQRVMTPELEALL
jgi:predicted transcriptional regulator of viral defense system